MNLMLAFFMIVAGLWLIDGWQHHRHQHQEPAARLRSAAIWSILYIAAALAFAALIGHQRGPDDAWRFLTGYALEKALAFDNLAIFVAVFHYFNIPARHQHRILHWGILGAVIFRGLFVSAGLASHWALSNAADTAFALIILYTAGLMLRNNSNNRPDYHNAWYLRPFKHRIAAQHHSQNAFFRRHAGTGQWCVTSAFLALITIEVSDIIFAMDSVPAIIAITRDPFLVYSAVLFAVLGLRALYFVLSALMDICQHLEKAVIVILILIAVKLLASSWLNYHLSAGPLLVIILSLLGIGIITSLLDKRSTEKC